MVRIKFVHKVYLAVLVGVIVFGVTFAGVHGLVLAVNGIAGSDVFHPYFFPLLLAMIGFFVPVAGSISVDFDEREAEG